MVYAFDDPIVPHGSRRSTEEIVAFMEREVMPFARQALGPVVGGADNVTCETCHGGDAAQRNWQMPGVRALPEPELRLAGLERARPWLDPQMRNAVYGYLAEEDKQSVASYMRQVVMPGMAKLMHRPAYDFAQSYRLQPLARRGRVLSLPSGRVRSSRVESSEECRCWPQAALAFCLVAILNCGGYRYGIGDQAFYIPAVTQHLDPDLFPRDRAILHAQDRFMLYDDAIAAFVRVTGVSVPAVFFVGYLAGLALLFGATRRHRACRCTQRGWALRCSPRS